MIKNIPYIAALLLLMSCNLNSEKNNTFISPQSKSDKRLENLGLSKKENQINYMLDETRLNFPITEVSKKESYRTNPNIEWAVELKKNNGEFITTEEISAWFDGVWGTSMVAITFGLKKDGSWTYAFSGDSPSEYSNIEIVFSLTEIVRNTSKTSNLLPNYLETLKEILKDKDCIIMPKYPLEKAVERLTELKRIHSNLNKDIIIKIKLNEATKGIEVWNTLQNIGLQWGDGDLFHWDNSKNYGHERHFSVWTSSDPGYFIPQQIKAETFNPKDLLFGFSIPRSADPQNIFDIMLEATTHCAKQLGGQLVDMNNQPYNAIEEKTKLKKIIESINEEGYKPGTDELLFLF